MRTSKVVRDKMRAEIFYADEVATKHFGKPELDRDIGHWVVELIDDIDELEAKLEGKK